MNKEQFNGNRNFKDELVDFFKKTNKTGWGKNEIQTQIRELWIEFLEDLIERRE